MNRLRPDDDYFLCMHSPATPMQIGALQLFDERVNDVFLTVGSGAVREFLLSIDALPPDPIVVNAARSYRRAEHGDLGNRIVSLHPHLATDLADPVERFHAIQASMAAEVERSRLQEPLMDQPAAPFGARKLRAQMAARVEGGGAVLPATCRSRTCPGPTHRGTSPATA